MKFFWEQFERALICRVKPKFDPNQITLHISAGLTDLIRRGEIELEYCPTDKMLADYMTKPLVGSKYMSFRDGVIGASPLSVDSRSVLVE